MSGVPSNSAFSDHQVRGTAQDDKLDSKLQEQQSSDPVGEVDPVRQVDPEMQVDPVRQVDPEMQVDPKRQVDPEMQVDPKRQVDPETQVEPEGQVDLEGQFDLVGIVDAVGQSDPVGQVDPSGKLKVDPVGQVDHVRQDLLDSNNIASTTEGDEALKRCEEELRMDCEDHSGDQQYHFIHYNLNVSPQQVTGAWQDFNLMPSNFLKGCRWSPDGTCVLTNSDDNVLRIFNLPVELYTGAAAQGLPEMISVLQMSEGETVYDYCWYPYMSSFDPDTCCLLSSSRDHPIHLWDAFTGTIRCTYRAYNHLDELVAANCISFNLDGSRIYCGFNKIVRIFDTSRPGKDNDERPTVVKKEGQSGIISSIAFSPENLGLYALGSYSKSVGLYSESTGEMICLLQGQLGGVTHVLFSPDGTKLYSGGRKDDEILCWDVRNPGTVLYRMLRTVNTNQRVYFDIDRSGQYVLSGNADGTVTFWDTKVPPVYDDVTSSEPTLQHALTFVAHGDFVNGVSFHPSLPLLATSSGQRQFSEPGYDSEDDHDATSLSQRTAPQADNSLRIWAACAQ